MDYSKLIWDYLLRKIGNAYGVAGLMGNLQAESGLCPYRVQGDFSSGWTESIEYTAKVDSGEISKDDFIYNGPGGGGYGLAQWTFWSRKKALYEKWKNDGYSSIGSIDLALEYLTWELENNYSYVWNTLKQAASIREASDCVLHSFENPANQSESVEILRESLGQGWFDKYYSGSAPSNPSTPTKRKRMSLMMMYFASKRVI